MGQSEQDTNSVFDFLYVDHTRVAIFHSQLPDETRGHLKGISAEDASTGQVVGKVGMNALATGELSTTQGFNSRQTSTYDPMWLNAREFLDVFDENGLLRRDDGEPSTNELRLFRGKLSVRDMRVLKPVWGALVHGMAETQFTSALGRGGGHAAKQMAAAVKKAMSNFLESMPQTITGSLVTGGNTLWFTLRPEHIMMTVEELFLKLGVNLPGEWHMAAIVDGGDPRAFEVDSEREPEGVEAASDVLFTQLGKQFGRPDGTIAVTPILIFRKIG